MENFPLLLSLHWNESLVSSLIKRLIITQATLTLCIFSDGDCVFKMGYMAVNGNVHTVSFFSDCDCVFKMGYMAVSGSVHFVLFSEM